MTHWRWVNGVPNRPSSTDWMAYLADLLLDRPNIHPPRPSTLAAETGLGLGRSTYWYVGCAVEAYSGEAVALWDPTPDLAHAAGGLCPFDTGGLWAGKFIPDPPLPTVTDVVDYFHECDRPLSVWPDTVTTEITRGWPTVQAYVNGLPPTFDITPRSHSSHSSPQAWIWEGRVEAASSVTGSLTVRELFWTEANRRRFLSWLLRTTGLDGDDRRAVLATVARVSRVVGDPFPAVRSELLSLASSP